jgi:phytoene/squalene synthetase
MDASKRARLSRTSVQPFLIGLTRLGGDADFSLMPSVFPSEVRLHVLAFSAFIRLADHIADSTGLTRQDKLNRLGILEAALGDEPIAPWSEEASCVIHNMRHSLRETRVSSRHAQRIVRAFLCDVMGDEKRTWQDLLAYCDNAAAPVGRYFLELLHEDPSICGKPADDLCAALRILRRLRDTAGPFNRLCIPTQFMNDAMISIDHLKASSAKGQTRAVIDRVLDGVDRLLRNAEPLPGLIRQRGLRMHTSIVLCRAQKLAARFREEDPLQGRLTLSRWQRFRCRWTALIRELVGRG